MVHDPVADPETVDRAYGVTLRHLGDLTDLSALVVAVAHDKFGALDAARLSQMLAADGVVVDVRSKIDLASLRPDLCYWSVGSSRAPRAEITNASSSTSANAPTAESA
jgi:UDP-N-acetyl-D-galactosamine dehydrogenase